MLKEMTRMTAHPVISSFEPDTEQVHIQSLENFLRWEWKVKMHHLLLGKVRRIEFAREWLAARWRTLKGTALLIPDDTGKLYAPDVLYPWMCKEPVDTRRS